MKQDASTFNAEAMDINVEARGARGSEKKITPNSTDTWGIKTIIVESVDWGESQAPTNNAETASWKDAGPAPIMGT